MAQQEDPCLADPGLSPEGGMRIWSFRPWPRKAVRVTDLGLSLCGRVQDWLHVEDRRSVEDFEVTYENAQARNGKDL